MTDIDSSGAVLIGTITSLTFVLLYVWTALALAAVFRKHGEEGWKAWVPILNTVVLLQLGGVSGWLLLLVLIPIVGSLVVWALLIVACYRINRAFGHGVGMTVLAALLLPVWATILGFGSSRWLGADTPVRRAPEPDEPAADLGDRWSVPAASGFAPASSVAPSAALRGGFDLGAVGELTSEVTDAAPGAPAPVSAVLGGGTDPSGARSAAPAPITRVPIARTPPPVEPWAPPPMLADDSPFPEMSGEVSAIAGSPQAGSPRSARRSVSAQYMQPEIPADVVDETVITRRRRTAWTLVPPTAAPVPITADVVIIGRKPSADPAFPGAQLVSIDDGTVSKTHARLELRADRWYITDLDSTNGVLFATLMGTEVEAVPGVEIEAGERFILGDAEVRVQRSDR